MTVSTIRQKLMDYLAYADDSKIKALYMLLEKEIEGSCFTLSDEQIQILETERQLHLSGKSKSYTMDEARQIIKGQMAF